MRLIIQEKDQRLGSKQYRLREQSSSSFIDYAGRHVYPNDAEEIKAHKWFRDIPWDRLHMTVPPFVPAIKSMDDTHYFDEEDPISDFSESVDQQQAGPGEVADALKHFNREIQILAKGFIEKPYDTARLKKIEKEIETFNMADEQKEWLKAFVRHYGKKEKKRPRDKLLRDKDTAAKVLELRKKGAFLGYTYRRYRPTRETYGRASTGSRRSAYWASGSMSGKRTVWHRARISIN